LSSFWKKFLFDPLMVNLEAEMRKKRGNPIDASHERTATASASRAGRAGDHPVNATGDKSGHGERCGGWSSAQWAAFVPECRCKHCR
jgi:hypothetical protein